jgi:hypothetical protein
MSSDGRKPATAATCDTAVRSALSGTNSVPAPAISGRTARVASGIARKEWISSRNESSAALVGSSPSNRRYHEVARQLDSAVRYAVRRSLGVELARLTIHVDGLRVRPTAQRRPTAMDDVPHVTDLAGSGTDVA